MTTATRRTRFLLAYDVSDPKRLHGVHKVALTFGEPLQYSVFICDLMPDELVRLRMALREHIHHAEDRVVLVNLGPAAGRAARAIEVLGRQHLLPPSGDPVIV
jgi:CRISPR-associated protein Cas2